MTKKWIGALLVIFLAGTYVAWKQVLWEFVQFYALEGTLFKLWNCVVPNPVTTPCFWGAIAFVVGLVWTLVWWQRARSGQAFSVNKMWWFSLACALFAWGNFGYQLYLYYYKPGSTGQCFVGKGPWESACFYGSTLFLLSLIVLSFHCWRKGVVADSRKS